MTMMRVTTRFLRRSSYSPLRWPHNAWVALLLGLYFVVAVASLLAEPRLGSTYDEPHHLLYGMNMLEGNPDRFDDSKMPVSAWNALPTAFMITEVPEAELADVLASRSSTTLFVTRLMTLLAALLLGFLIYRWARELYGDRAGLLALSLFVVDANLLAHGRLVTTDLYAALFITAATYFFWRFQLNRNPDTQRRSAVALGAAQLAKYTSVFLVPIFVVLTVVRHWHRLKALARQRHPWRNGRPMLRRAGRCAIYFVLVGLLVVNIGYFFRHSFTPLGDYEFRSETFRSIQQALPASLPVPVPRPYLEGLDWVRERERAGSVFGGLYLFGEMRLGKGFDGYYFAAYLYKVPLAIQILFIAAMIFYWRRRKKFDFRRDEAFLLLPVLFFFFYFNFMYAAHTGLRFLLVAFPFMHVFTASLLAKPVAAPTPVRRTIGVLVATAAISVLSYHPHYLAYFNELVPDRKMAYRILADSNLDWGGGWYLYEQWAERHPEALYEPAHPTVGTVVAGVNSYVGIAADGHLDWMRALDKRPVDHIAYSFLVFEFTPEDMERLPERFRSTAPR